MGRTHGVDEVSCAHSGQKPAWLISRYSSISFEPTFTEYAAEIAQFCPLILSSLEQEKHAGEYISPCNHDAVPSARHQIWTRFGPVLYPSYCSSRPGFLLQAKTCWGFTSRKTQTGVSWSAPPKESVPHMSRGMSLTGTVPSCVSFSPSSSSSSLLSDSSLEEE